MVMKRNINFMTIFYGHEEDILLHKLEFALPLLHFSYGRDIYENVRKFDQLLRMMWEKEEMENHIYIGRPYMFFSK